MRAIGENLSQRGASQQPPLRSCVTITLSLVIAIEKIGISVVENGIAGDMVAQQEGLEKPAGMGKMPFGRRRIIHRLHGGVCVAQTFRQPDRMAADVSKTSEKIARSAIIICVRRRHERTLWLAGDQSYSGGSSVSFQNIERTTFRSITYIGRKWLQHFVRPSRFCALARSSRDPQYIVLAAVIERSSEHEQIVGEPVDIGQSLRI